MKSLASLLLLFVSTANADTWLKCPNCTSERMAIFAPTFGTGIVVIYNAPTKAARRFKNEKTAVGITSLSVPLLEGDIKVIESLHTLYVGTYGKNKARINVNIDNKSGVGMGGMGPITKNLSGPSAADYVNNAAHQRDVHNFIEKRLRVSAVSKNAALWAAWNAIVTAKVSFAAEDLWLRIKLIHSDQSLVIVEYEIDSPDAVRFVGAVDADAVQIMTPKNALAFRGTLRFENGGALSAQNWIANARYCAVPVTVTAVRKREIPVIFCKGTPRKIACERTQ